MPWGQYHKHHSDEEEEDCEPVRAVHSAVPSIERDAVKPLKRLLSALRILRDPKIDVLRSDLVLARPKPALNRGDEQRARHKQHRQSRVRPAEMFGRRNDEADECEAKPGEKRGCN